MRHGGEWGDSPEASVAWLNWSAHALLKVARKAEGLDAARKSLSVRFAKSPRKKGEKRMSLSDTRRSCCT